MTNPESLQKTEIEPNDTEIMPFTDKLKDLLPGVDFEETPELLDARIAALEALSNHKYDTDILQHVWTEYAKICEQIVDDMSGPRPEDRARLQITMLVHKALIFLESGNRERYGEELSDAEEYAYTRRFDEIATAIGSAIDELTG